MGIDSGNEISTLTDPGQTDQQQNEQAITSNKQLPKDIQVSRIPIRTRRHSSANAEPKSEQLAVASRVRRASSAEITSTKINTVRNRRPSGIPVPKRSSLKPVSILREGYKIALPYISNLLYSSMKYLTILESLK